MSTEQAGLQRRPDHLVEIAYPGGMSNYDHSIEPGIEKELREKAVFTRHAGWHFNGQVWFQDGLFFEEVRRYHCHISTVAAPSLKELMCAVNNLHGWE